MMSSCSSIGVEQLTNDPRSKGSNPVSVDTGKEKVALKSVIYVGVHLLG